jgi:hypothetical protein
MMQRLPGKAWLSEPPCNTPGDTHRKGKQPRVSSLPLALVCCMQRKKKNAKGNNNMKKIENDFFSKWVLRIPLSQTHTFSGFFGL